MKRLLVVLCFALIHATLFAQDLSSARTSPERKAILDALRPHIAKEAGVPVSFVVEHMKVQGAWAFMRGVTKRADGGEVAWDKSPTYRELARDGLFDGGGTAALLKKISGRWKPVVYVIGPTDVAWACWWKEYGAPRAVFDLAEDCQ